MFNFIEHNLKNWRWWAVLPIALFVGLPLVAFYWLLVLAEKAGNGCGYVAEKIDTGPAAKASGSLHGWVRKGRPITNDQEVT